MFLLSTEILQDGTSIIQLSGKNVKAVESLLAVFEHKMVG